MKIAFATLALSVAATLTACQTVVPNQSSSVGEVAAVKSDAALKNILQAYTWSYQPENSSNPIIYQFTEDRLVGNAGCNTLSTSWDVTSGKIKTGKVMSTMIGCPETVMQQEGFAARMIEDRQIQIHLDQTNSKAPVLIMQNQDGKKYAFVGTETPETKYQGQAERIFLEVSPELKDCVGVVPQKCLQVREIKYSEQGLKTSVGDWQLFYDQIEGYEHNPNLRTVLRLKRFTIANPAADQSKYAYIHDMTVEQEIIK